MRRLIVVLSVALLLAPALSLLLGSRADEEAPAPAPIAVPREATRAAPAPEPAPPPFTTPREDSLYAEAARTAWRYVASQTHESTGLPNSVIGYPYATVWDVGSALAAIHSARRLGLIDEPEYDRRMTRALRTLGELRLFDGAAFNKNYQVARGVPAGRNDRERPPRPDGYGWSVVDIGRLLVWLKIVERSDPEHAPAAAAVVRRLDRDRLVSDGYLMGGTINTAGEARTRQEGRIGYEQYAAAGFALWGIRADRALNWEGNVEEVRVLDVPLLVDRRPGAHLTGEPFYLMGIELGWWDPRWREQAERAVAAQAERHERTGQLTMVSEDAIPVAPYFFYYYTLYDAGEPFAVRALGSRVPDPEPRWVSAKAAFAWYALLPGPYTWRVVEAVAARAAGPDGWSSGFYERTGRPTGSPNINTAAVILESAVYRASRRPLVTAP